jgi:hypothetical protein
VTRYEVLHSQIQYAAGVMTVTNSNRMGRTVLAKGTIFSSQAGQLYKSVSPITIPPARVTYVRAGRVRRAVATPSATQMWVQALERGDGSVSRTTRPYTVEGMPGAAAAGIKATAYSITRDEQTFWGSRKSYIFDPASERYVAVSNMNLARWYPTLVRLENGKVLAVSGLDQFGRVIVGNTEQWDPATRSWTFVRALTKSFPTYPALFLMSSGMLFFTGSNAGFGPAIPEWRTPGIWNPYTNAFTAVLGMRDHDETETSGSVLLPPAQDQRYAVIGGAGVGESTAATGRIDVADLNQASPTWRPAARLPQPTRYPEAVITPDDKVVIAGGSREYRGKHASDIFECHLYDPQTSRLTSLAESTVGRDYHAEALLLPDGRILTLGGNPLFGNGSDNSPGFFEQRIEIFTPPYLYRGPRPRLTSGPARLALGETGVFSTPDAAQIVAARLMRPSAVTHVTDLEQRSIALDVRRKASAVSLRVPSSAGLVPPGWYMLFVTNRKGTPSVSRWVHIEGAAPGGLFRGIR